MSDLVALAREARRRAYAPYSGYAVGAAVRSVSGQVFTGCNVENVVYGASICAERSAVLQMVAAGELEIAAVAVSTLDGGTPCGLCLQVLFEFSRDPERVQVFTAADEAEVRCYTLLELMPHAFQSVQVKRTER